MLINLFDTLIVLLLKGRLLLNHFLFSLSFDQGVVLFGAEHGPGREKVGRRLLHP